MVVLNTVIISEAWSIWDSGERICLDSIVSRIKSVAFM